MPRKFCPHCGGTFTGKRCACRPRPKRKPTEGDKTRAQREPWRNNYSDGEYRRNRQEVIERQRGCCKDCGAVCAKHDGTKWVTAPYGGEVDHEVPLCEGGTNDVSNMALRCKRCHGKAEAKRRRRRADLARERARR